MTKIADLLRTTKGGRLLRDYTERRYWKRYDETYDHWARNVLIFKATLLEPSITEGLEDYSDFYRGANMHRLFDNRRVYSIYHYMAPNKAWWYLYVGPTPRKEWQLAPHFECDTSSFSEQIEKYLGYWSPFFKNDVLITSDP